MMEAKWLFLLGNARFLSLGCPLGVRGELDTWYKPKNAFSSCFKGFAPLYSIAAYSNTPPDN